MTSIEHGFAIATGGEVTIGQDDAGTPVVDVPAAVWAEAAAHARAELDMDFLDWLSAVDQPDGDPAGVDVVLHVASLASVHVEPAPGTARRVRRLLLRTRVAETALSLPSLTSLWPGVAWHERETFEMFGVAFTGFDDGTGLGVRPLLLPEGFEGTPLRKSFVLAARAAKAWPGAKDPADVPGKAPSRRKMQPPGVPDPSWGPREPGAEPPPAQPERPARPVRKAAARRPVEARTPVAALDPVAAPEGAPEKQPSAEATSESPSGSQPTTTAASEPAPGPARADAKAEVAGKAEAREAGATGADGAAEPEASDAGTAEGREVGDGQADGQSDGQSDGQADGGTDGGTDGGGRGVGARKMDLGDGA